MIILDSSVIIACFRKEEVHHTDAVEILNSGEKFLLFDCVLSEVLTVIKMREGYEVMQKCSDFLLHNKDITLEQIKDYDLHKTSDFFRKHNNNLSFVDTILFLQSKKRKIPLATFDKALTKHLI